MAQDRLVLPAKFPADPEACKPVTAAFFKCLETETALEKRNVRVLRTRLHSIAQAS